MFIFFPKMADKSFKVEAEKKNKNSANRKLMIFWKFDTLSRINTHQNICYNLYMFCLH